MNSAVLGAARCAGRVRPVQLRSLLPSTVPCSRRGYALDSGATLKKSQLDMNTFPPEKNNTILNICPQGFNDVVTRFGRFSRVVEPGMYFAIPFVDQIHRVDMREMTIEILPATGITQDNVSVQTGGALYVQVVDAKRACFDVRRPLQAVLVHGISVMRSRIGTVELDMLFHERKKLNDELVAAVSDAANKWGLKVLRYELTDVIPDEQVAKAMDSQATAERRRRETILNAEAERERMQKESLGQKQSHINVAEGLRQKVILEAEAEKSKRVLEATGQAEALDVVAKVLATPEGRDAMNFLMAQSYCNALTTGLNSSSTVFMQKDVSDVAGVLAQGMGVLSAMQASGAKHLAKPPAPPAPSSTPS